MTTATTPTMGEGKASVRRSGSPLAGTGTLVRFQLRRDRVRLLAWVGGFTLFIMYLVSVIPAAYGTDSDLAASTQLFNDPVGRMLIGPGYGFDQPTLERFVVNGYGLYFLILAGLMSILLVSRHTRAEEQTGRAELVSSNVVGRYATLTAALITVAITNVGVGVATLAVIIAVGGFAVGGSVLFAAGIVVTGLLFAGLTTITVQLTEYSRAASGLAGAVLGVAFVVRAGGDMAGEGGTALSWFSPLAWGQQTAPFVLDRWWPLVLGVGVAVATTAIGYRLSTRRDLGASMFAVRPGRARAAASLGSPWGLALRLQRPNILGWGVALVISGMVFGSYIEPLTDALADLPDVFVELFGNAENMVDGYLAYMAVFMAFLASAYAITAVQGLRTEETVGRLDPVLATPISRWSWFGTNLAVTAGAVVVIMAATGAATGLGAAVVTGDAAHIGKLTVAHLNQVPGVLVVLGVAALLFGALPRLLPATWVIVGYGVVAGTFGPMLDLPEAAYNLSPYEHPARMPLEEFAAAPVTALTVLALVTAALGLVAFRRRAVNAV